MIVGVSGLKRSGKDTVAELLVKEYGFERYSFADPIKEAMSIVFDWDDRYLYGELKEIIDPRWGISPRQVFQHFGTEYAQHILPEVFPERRYLSPPSGS